MKIRNVYEAPEIELLEIEAEQVFAGSVIDTEQMYGGEGNWY